MKITGKKENNFNDSEKIRSGSPWSGLFCRHVPLFRFRQSNFIYQLCSFLCISMKNIFRSTTFMAIVAAWLWSTAFVGVKIGLEYHSPLQFAGIRFFLSGLFILLFMGRFKQIV